MSEPYLGEIMMFGGNFAIRAWAFCDGQLLPIAQNTALFSILGTTYGGDGRSTFGLPEMRGRFPIHAGSGTGPGLSQRRLGAKGGAQTVTLTTSEIPSHTHNPIIQAETRRANSDDPEGNMLAARTTGYRAPAPSANVSLSEESIVESSVGGGQSHENMPPFIAVNYLIALQGIFPSRS
ncbi:phage tail protein [Pacificoceanicola onchidii]|uniref:phage tail protein n=1 Tax=Pacificoceanicola onchidii TaxID=2562685 RepID=UPI0010A6659E|nr:tail fiber protein [Pacificoceanicola onchidii]